MNQKVENLEPISRPTEEKRELTKEEYLEGEEGKIYKGVYPIKLKEGEGYVADLRVKKIIDHLGQTKPALFPRDFELKKSTLYDVKIAHDSQPGKKQGYWILEVLGEYEREEDKLKEYLKGEWNRIYEVLPEKIIDSKTGKKLYYTSIIIDHLGISKKGWFPENWEPTDSESLYKVKIISDSQPGEERGRWLLEVSGKSLKKEIEQKVKPTETQTFKDLWREKKRK